MKYFLVTDSADPQKYAIVGASGFVPNDTIKELPPELAQEEAEWLTVSDSQDEFGRPIKVVSVNEELKTQILAERQLASQASDRLALRTRKRNFGERLIDEISLLNEASEVNLEGLEAMIMDPDLMIIRELLWTGSIKSAHTKLVELETKCTAIFGEPNYLLIKSKMEQFLQSIGEL